MSESTKQHIFITSDGYPLPVFVEASGIFGRPKIVRKLKKAGARICSNATQAAVILVDPSTAEGRQFIREWGHDGNKIVLEYGWATKCVNEHKLLGAQDGWGDCIAIDDGLPLNNENVEDDEQINASPALPTPRVTPVEASPVIQDPKQKEETIGLKIRVKPGRKPTSTKEAEDATASSSYPSPAVPVTQVSPDNYPVQGISQSAQIVPPELAQLHQNTALLSLMQSGNFAGHSALPPTDSSVDHTVLLNQLLNLQQLLPLMQPYIPSFILNSMTTPSAPISPKVQSSITVSEANNIQSTKPITVTIPIEIRTRPQSPPRVTRSLSHTAASLSSPVEKGKGKQFEGIHVKQESDIETALSASASEAALSRIFHSHGEKPHTFYVHLDTPGRFKLVNEIKKHGGKIVSDHDKADLVVLYSQAKTFPDLFRTLGEKGKIPVSPSFIHDSIKQRTLLDPRTYTFAPPQVQRKRGRPPTHEDDPPKTIKVRKERKPKRQKIEFPISNSEVPSTPANAKASQNRTTPDAGPSRQPQSPTPPPPHSKTLSGARGQMRCYKYSEPERDFMMKYIDTLLERDHTMPLQNISQHLHDKLPHHSARSWAAFMSSNFREEISALRKRKSVAARKAQSAAHICKPEPRDPESFLSASLGMDGYTFSLQALQEDIETVARFYAYGGDGGARDEDEAAIWSRLAAQARCQTAPSWEEFYAQNYVRVSERYQEIVNSYYKGIPAL